MCQKNKIWNLKEKHSQLRKSSNFLSMSPSYKFNCQVCIPFLSHHTSCFLHGDFIHLYATHSALPCIDIFWKYLLLLTRSEQTFLFPNLCFFQQKGSNKHTCIGKGVQRWRVSKAREPPGKEVTNLEIL